MTDRLADILSRVEGQDWPDADDRADLIWCLAEIERLREALRDLMLGHEWFAQDSGAYVAAMERARKALEDQP